MVQRPQARAYLVSCGGAQSPLFPYPTSRAYSLLGISDRQHFGLEPNVFICIISYLGFMLLEIQMRHFFYAAALVVAAIPAQAQDFTISFNWGDIPLCTSGRPNTVSNPEFVVRGLPAGTETIEFRLVDLDVPSYNHGGATLRMSASGRVPSGLFNYKSPCPPNGRHTYEWRAEAKSGRTVLGEARARRMYPE